MQHAGQAPACTRSARGRVPGLAFTSNSLRRPFGRPFRGRHGARGTLPDLVVLDVTMLGLDGLTVLREIRALSAVPVIMLSGRGGNGLGLPIARALVELHGGRLWLESVPGRGATFWMALPAGQPIEA
jgi:CheY-like chemotaxis protein